MIERQLTIENAEKFCTFLMTHQFNEKIGKLITGLVAEIAVCKVRRISLLEMHVTAKQLKTLTDYLASIDKGEIQKVERSVQGNWQLFLDELTDTVDIPF